MHTIIESPHLDNLTGPLFNIGHLVATDGASDLFMADQEDCMEYLRRHVNGEWADMYPEDRAANLNAIKRGGRVFSSFKTKQQKLIWIITEANRSVTTFLLPSEY